MSETSTDPDHFTGPKLPEGPRLLEWQPSAIQVAETVLAGTEPPVKPSMVTDADFTKLWNRVVHMDKAVLELIDHYRGMKNELAMAVTRLNAKQDKIETLETMLGAAQLDIIRLRGQLGEHDDRINWLET